MMKPGEMSGAELMSEFLIEERTTGVKVHRWFELRDEIIRLINLARLNAGGSGQEGRFETTEKLWDEYRKFRELPAFTKLPLDTQLFAQYVVGYFWGASQPLQSRCPKEGE